MTSSSIYSVDIKTCFDDIQCLNIDIYNDMQKQFRQQKAFQRRKQYKSL